MSWISGCKITHPRNKVDKIRNDLAWGCTSALNEGAGNDGQRNMTYILLAYFVTRALKVSEVQFQ